MKKIEVQAITSLMNNSIIIKPADKGGANAIINRQDYIKEGMRHLEKRRLQPLEEDPTRSFQC